VFLNRLESGFLLFETPRGLVRVEPSLWQRVYLLWTFRNFRRLSIPLLNQRQRALVSALFRDHASAVSDSRDSLLVIGVVEHFVPPTVRAGASTVQQKERPKKVAAQRAEIVPKPHPVRSYSPKVAWSKVATTVGALSLCAVFVLAWHRVQGIPGSQAHDQPRLQQINMIAPPNSSHVEEPAGIAKSPTVVPSAATAQPLAIPKAAVQLASITAVIPPPKQGTRIHLAAPTPDLPLSGQDNGIQASRPPLRFVYPVYPDVRTRGVVALTAWVDSDGTVRTVRVVSGNRALAAAAVRAVRQWRYRPYLKDGEPVATETNIVISFISEDAISMTFPPSVPAWH
jgi:TonB family protein